MKAGIYQAFPSHAYYSDPCDKPSLNYSTAKVIVQESPWHAYRQHPRLGGETFEPNKKMDRGSIVHALLLGQPLDGIETIDAKDYKTKAVQAQRDSARTAGRFVILKREHDEILENLPIIRVNLLDAGIDLTGPCEMTAIWNSDGTRCRTRIDNITNDFALITDLKCGEDANPVKLERHIHDMCYDLQAAVEIDAIETLKPEMAGRVKFCDAFIEMKYPYFVVRVDHSESMLEVGRSKWRRAKALWEECLSSGKWPGYRNRMTAHATNWAYAREFGEQVQ